VDFGQVGTANLWKSDLIFSTGRKEAELKIVQLRLNLRSAAARFHGSRRGRGSSRR
jgi:hypothetical protein